MDVDTLILAVKILLIAEAVAILVLAAVLVHVRRERRERSQRVERSLRAVVRLYILQEQGGSRRETTRFPPA